MTKTYFSSWCTTPRHPPRPTWLTFWKSFRNCGASGLLCSGFLASWSLVLLPLADFYRRPLRHLRHYCNACIHLWYLECINSAMWKAKATYMARSQYTPPGPVSNELPWFINWHKWHNSDTEGIKYIICDSIKRKCWHHVTKTGPVRSNSAGSNFSYLELFLKQSLVYRNGNNNKHTFPTTTTATHILGD